MAASTSGNWLFTTGCDRTLRQWNLSTGQQHKVVEGFGSQADYLSLDGTDHFLASRHENELRLWRTDTLAVIAELVDDEEDPYSSPMIAFSRNSPRLAIANRRRHEAMAFPHCRQRPRGLCRVQKRREGWAKFRIQ